VTGVMVEAVEAVEAVAGAVVAMGGRGTIGTESSKRWQGGKIGEHEKKGAANIPAAPAAL